MRQSTTPAIQRRTHLILALGVLVTIVAVLACSCSPSPSVSGTFTPSPPALSPTPTATPRPTVDHYTFLLKAFQIFNTRSRNDDTDTIAFSVSVDGQRYPIQVHRTGDIDNGTYFQYMRFVDVAIPSTAKKVVMSYQLINAGHTITDEAMEEGATILADSAVTFGTGALGVGWVSTFAVPLLNAGIGYAFADCDGPVAVDAIAFSPADLASATASTSKVLTEVRDYPGSDPPSGCRESSYKVHWSIARATQSSMVYDLASELAIGQYWADYGQTGFMDDTLHDMQRLVSSLSDAHVLPAPTVNLFGYVHQQLGNGKSIDGAFAALRDELSTEMDQATGTGRYRDMVVLGTYLSLSEAQCVSPLSNWPAAKALVHSYLQTVQSLVDDRYSTAGFDQSTLADALRKSGQPPLFENLEEGLLYQEIVMLRFAFGDTIRKVLP